MSDGFSIRPIEPRDDPAVAAIIRSVMTEFGACGPGYAILDPEVDGMSMAYSVPRAGYWVVEHATDGSPLNASESSSRIFGGGGFAALEGARSDTCELRKMYFLNPARGRGLGARLLRLNLDAARQSGFRRCYLETLESMKSARRLYEAFGFRKLRGPLGNTGHYGCNAWYALEL